MWNIRSNLSAVLTSSIFLLTTMPAGAADAIGQVKTEAGSAIVLRQGTSNALHVGDHVYQSDIVSTGDDGTVGITFADNSMMSLGPDSKLALDQFRFDATTHAGIFDTSLQTGTMVVKSGQIVQQTPYAMQIRTPAALLGVRGTKFLVRANGGVE